MVDRIRKNDQKCDENELQDENCYKVDRKVSRRENGMF